MSYSSSFQDAMIQIGDTWVRASRVESVRAKPYQIDGMPDAEDVTVRLISGRTIEARMAQGGAKDIARKAVGLP